MNTPESSRSLEENTRYCITSGIAKVYSEEIKKCFMQDETQSGLESLSMAHAELPFGFYRLYEGGIEIGVTRIDPDTKQEVSGARGQEIGRIGLAELNGNEIVRIYDDVLTPEVITKALELLDRQHATGVLVSE